LPQLDEIREAVVDERPQDPRGTASGILPSALSDTPHERSRLEWLIPAALCALLWGQLFFSSRQLSQTADEATHLYSGYRYLKCGDLTVSPEHPPLAKVIAAAPLLAMNFAVNCAPFQGNNVQQAFASLNWLYSQNWPVALARARIAISVFAVGLCLLVWIVARRMFGLATAVVAGLLLVFEPNLLAYGPLVMTDVPVTCMLLFAVFGFYLWITRRKVSFLLLTALATGLTLLTKHSGAVVLPILAALAVTDVLHQSGGQTGSDRPKWRLALHNLLAVSLICFVAAGIVWAGYALRFAANPAASPLQDQRPPAASGSERVLRGLEALHLMPQAYLQGFASAIALSDQSSVAFVAGKVYLHAPWFSTPFNFVIRNTAAMLVMIVMAAFGVAFAFRQRHRELLFLLVPVAVYLAVCIHASTNVSVRYLLPTFPFLVIMVAAGCVELARRTRWVTCALPCLILLHAASSLHAYPNYLSYANDLWGGPKRAYKYEPWLDLGQAYPEVKTYLQKHPARNCWLITGWHWDPAFYGVPCQTFGLYLPHEIPRSAHGTFIVSSTLLTDVRLMEGELAAAFKNTTPIDHIGGSALLVYEGDFDTSLDAAVGERNLATYALSVGSLPAALEHGKKAVDLAPASALAHANLCMLLASTEIDAALNECYTARSLLLDDPLRQESIRAYYLSSIENSLTMLITKYRTVYGHEPEIAPFVAPVKNGEAH
jgi:Dolichyl-phosphate-mannose-protein mannosyltransferase